MNEFFNSFTKIFIGVVKPMSGQKWHIFVSKELITCIFP